MNTEDIAGDAVERLAEITETRGYDIDVKQPDIAFVDGYIEGYAAGRVARWELCYCADCRDERGET